MVDILLGIFGGSIIGLYIYTEIRYYKNYKLILEDKNNEQHINNLIEIVKKEMKILPNKSSLNLYERKILIIHITNILNKNPEKNYRFKYASTKYKLKNMIEYLKNPEMYKYYFIIQE